MMRSVAALVVLALMAGVATAQTASVPDLKGTWTGTHDAIVDGDLKHHPSSASTGAAGSYRISKVNQTYRIEGQQGRNFWGSFTSDHHKSRLIGSLSADGKTLYIALAQGVSDAVMLDADTIEACYRHANEKTAVVVCGILKRRK